MTIDELFDVVEETTTTTGTGALTVGGATTWHESFNDTVADGGECVIHIRHQEADEWEICESVYTHASTSLSRGTLLRSSTGSRVNFSAGTKDVWLVVGAKRTIFMNDEGRVAINDLNSTDVFYISHNGTYNLFETTAGAFRFTGDSSLGDAIIAVDVAGAGNEYGRLRVFDEDDAEWVDIYASGGYAVVQCNSSGTGESGLDLQLTGDCDAAFFRGVADGENPYLRVYGYDTVAGAAKALAFFVATDGAACLASSSGETIELRPEGSTGYRVKVEPDAHTIIVSNGTIGISNLDNAWLLIGDSTTGLGMDTNEIFFAGSGTTHFGNLDAQALRFYTDSAVRMSLDSTGDLDVANNIDLHGNLELEACIGSSAGVIEVDGNRFLHSYSHETGDTAVPAGKNTFLGEYAGNHTGGASATKVYHASYNTGLGAKALVALDNGRYNTAVGYRAGYSVEDGISNSYLGANAGKNNVNGGYNNHVGFGSFYTSTAGEYNIGLGSYTGYYVSSGKNNIFIGHNAGRYYTGNNNLETSNYCVVIGGEAEVLEDGSSNEIVIGYAAIGHGDATCTIGNSGITEYYFAGTLAVDTNDVDTTYKGIFGDPSSGAGKIALGRDGLSEGGIYWCRTTSFTVDASLYMDADEDLYLKNDFGGDVYVESAGNGYLDFADLRLDADDFECYAKLNVYAASGDIIIADFNGQSNGEAYARIVVDSASGADSQLSFQEAGTTRWTIGNDGDDSDKLKFMASAGAFDGTEVLELESGGDLNLLAGNFDLLDTDDSSEGVITKGGTRFLHNFHDATGGGAVPEGNNVFLGEDAGNFTVGSTATQTYHGSRLVGIGADSLQSITTGHSNVAVGKTAMKSAQTSQYCVALGPYTLANIQTVHNHVAIGYQALNKITTGSSSVAVGYRAGMYYTGDLDLTDCSNGVYIGKSTLALEDGVDNEIVIGANTTGNGSNTVTIGNSSITDTYLQGDVDIEGGLTVSGGNLYITGAYNLYLQNAEYIGWEDSGGSYRSTITVSNTDNLLLGNTNLDDVIFKVGTLGEAVWIKETTGYVGIGTSSPSALLDARQSGGAAGDLFHLRDTTDSVDLFCRYDGDNYGLYSENSGGGYNYLTFEDTTGYIGIGTDDPGYQLEVNGDGYFAADLTVAGDVLPDATNTYTLGDSTDRWLGVYLESTINIGASVGTIRSERTTYDHDGLRIRTPNEAGTSTDRLQFTTGMAYGDTSESRITFLNCSNYLFKDGLVKVVDGNLEIAAGDIEIDAGGAIKIYDSTDTDFMNISHSGSVNLFETNAGAFEFTADSSLTNAGITVQVKGIGTGYGRIKVFDEDDDEYVDIYADGGYAVVQCNSTGTGENGLDLQLTGDCDAAFFRAAGSGENPVLRVYGYDTGESATRALAFYVDATGTANITTSGGEDLKLEPGNDVLIEADTIWGDGNSLKVVDSTGSDFFRMSHSGTVNLFETNAGAFEFTGDSSLGNAIITAQVKGAGTEYGRFKVFDEDDAEFVDIYASGGYAVVQCNSTATGEAGLDLQLTADCDAAFFRAAAAGENPFLRIYGDDGGTAKAMALWVGTDGTAAIASASGEDISLRPAGTSADELLIEAGGAVTANGDLTVDTADLYLNETTEADQTGIVYKGSNAWIHDFTPTDSDGFNVFIGENAGNFTMNPTVAGTHCEGLVGIGYNCLNSITTGYRNVALGAATMPAATEAFYCMAIGYAALNACTTGYENVAIGAVSLFGTTEGVRNTAIGNEAGRTNETGSYNVWIGNESGYNASAADDKHYQICIGHQAYCTGHYGIAIGKQVVSALDECRIGSSEIENTYLMGNLMLDGATGPTANNDSTLSLPDNTNDPTITAGEVTLSNVDGDFVVSTDSDKTLRLASVAYKDELVPPNAIRRGSSAPDWESFAPSGNLEAMGFDDSTEQEVFFDVQLNHDYKEGEDIYPHVHWSPGGTGTGTVRWGLEYSWANVDAAFAASTTVYVEDDGSGTAWDQQVAAWSALSGTGKTISSILKCRLFRDASHANDDYTGDAYFNGFDFHIPVDTLGSREEWVK